MRLPESRTRFEEELTFPIAHDSVLDSVGDVTIDAPYGESESVADVLGRSGQTEYRSADELHNALLTFVGDAYIGRKFYDDRGSNDAIDSETVSF
jgi:hypothetical protein